MQACRHTSMPTLVHRRSAGWPPRDSALAGVRAIAPLAAGLMPLALTVGTAAARSGLPPLVGWASSATLYGASGQLTWIQMTHSGAPAALVVGATLMVNMQLLLYGTAMRQVLVEQLAAVAPCSRDSSW